MLFEILDGVYSLSGSGVFGADGLGAVEQAAVAVAAIGVGAVFLARLTSRLDEAAGLRRLRYLKAGAAYVLGVLSVLLWTSLLVPIPGVVVGWFRQRRDRSGTGDVPAVAGVVAAGPARAHRPGPDRTG